MENKQNKEKQGAKRFCILPPELGGQRSKYCGEENLTCMDCLRENMDNNETN